MYYAPHIFKMAGAGEESALLQTVAVGGTNLIFTMLALLLIDHFGRKKLMLVGSIGYIISLSSVAWAFYDLKDYEKSIIYFKKVVSLKREEYINESLNVLSELTQAPDKLAQAKVILVQLKIKQKRYKEAEVLCHELISTFHDMDMSQLEIHVKQQLGMIYTKQSKYDDAINILKSAYDMSRQIDSLYDQYTVELKMLNVDVLKNKHNKKTLKRLHELLEKFKGYNDLEEVDFAVSVIEKIKFSKSKSFINIHLSP